MSRMPEFLEHAASRSRIMTDRTRIRDEIIKTGNQIRDTDELYERYLYETNGVSLFDNDILYMNVTDN